MGHMNARRRKPFESPGSVLSVPRGTTLAEFAEYDAAAEYVQKLVAGDFPARLISIVGTNPRTVERVTNKLTYARVALRGAFTGSWIGFIFAVVFGTVPQDMGNEVARAALGTLIVSNMLVAAGIFAAFNVIRFSLGRKGRNFQSSSMIIAEKYEVIVPDNFADQARKIAATPEV